jgi:hypothetical protein
MSDEAKTPTEPPPDWAYDWGRIPYDPNQDRAAFNMTTSGPSPMSPRSDWQAERGLGPQPGINLIDRMCINADQRERAQAQQPDLTQAVLTMMQMQSQTLAVLTALLSRMEDQKPKKAPASKDKQP